MPGPAAVVPLSEALPAPEQPVPPHLLFQLLRTGPSAPWHTAPRVQPGGTGCALRSARRTIQTPTGEAPIAHTAVAWGDRAWPLTSCNVTNTEFC